MVEGPQIVNRPFWVGVMIVWVARQGPHFGPGTRAGTRRLFLYLSQHKSSPGAFRCGGQTVPGAFGHGSLGHPLNRRQPE